MAAAGSTNDLFNAIAPGTGATFHPQRIRRLEGTVQCDFADFNTKEFKLEVQGRSGSSSNWHILAIFDETDMDRLGSAVLSVRLMPDMRAQLIANTGVASTVHAVLVE